jgi:4-hydroxy-tetrahydrodipicolinate synthase
MDVTQAKATFHGCYVATLTPFDPGNHLDEGVVRTHTQWLVEHGVTGLCPAGTTGEFLYLTDQEKRRVVAATVEAVGGRVPILAGVWALRETECADLARAAEEAGADGVFLPPPIYYPADDEVIFAHYRAVHEATSLPVFAYNIPQYAANAISFACLERLFAAGIIAGVKDSTGNVERVTGLVEKCGPAGVVFAASDSFATQGRKLGADGFISAIANLMPGQFARLWQGDESLQAEVDRVRGLLKQVGSIPGLKYLLARHGFAYGVSRLPFSGLTADQHRLLNELL